MTNSTRQDPTDPTNTPTPPVGDAQQVVQVPLPHAGSDPLPQQPAPPSQAVDSIQAAAPIGVPTQFSPAAAQLTVQDSHASPSTNGGNSTPVPCVITFPEIPERGLKKQTLSCRDALANRDLVACYVRRRSQYPTCNCGLRIVIRDFSDSARQPKCGPYAFARTPGSKHKCDRFSRNPTRPRVDSVEGQRKLQGPGPKKFRAEFSIYNRKEPTGPKRQDKKSHSSGKTSTPAISELGILQSLQTTARTHCMTARDYDGGRPRTIEMTIERLKIAAYDYRISCQRLTTICHFAHGDPLAGNASVQGKLDQVSKRNIRGIFIVGVARPFSLEVEDCAGSAKDGDGNVREGFFFLRIDGLSRPVHVPAVLKVNSQRRFKKILRNRQSRTLAIVWVEEVDGALFARRLAWQHMTQAGIPVASKHEAHIANLLVDQRRLFEKPLRETYRVEDATLQPDFILLDTVDVWYLEVWGMRLKKYKERRKVKTDAYRKSGLKLWEWVAYHKHAPKPFPEAAVAL
jgi:hypothetical protein